MGPSQSNNRTLAHLALISDMDVTTSAAVSTMVRMTKQARLQQLPGLLMVYMLAVVHNRKHGIH